MRHVNRRVDLEIPRGADLKALLNEAVAALAPGKMLVYRRAPSQSIPTKGIYAAAGDAATRHGCALVQWPEKPANVEPRMWCWAVQKPEAR